MDDNILERLSELEHVQWCEWAQSVSKDLSSLLAIVEKLDDESISKLSEDEKSVVLNVYDKLERWEKLMVPYSDLPEAEKEKDIVYARRALDILEH